MTATLFSNVGFELLDSGLFTLDARLGLKCDPVVSIELLLQLDNALISFIQSAGQGNHNVSLFEKQLLVAVNLCLAFFDSLALTLDFVQLCFILLSDAFLLFFQGRAELRSVFDHFTTRQNLRSHSLDLILKDAFVFLGL